tara:strand:- start:225 stop:1682 length:1458 start_codon:yes stop_codon:yes gene_type:complete
MEWKKGFLVDGDAPISKARQKKKADALPDDAFLPAESYDLGDDDDDEVDPRVAQLETSEEAHQYSVDYCRANCSMYNKGLIKLAPDATLNFCNDSRAVQFNRKIFGHHDGDGKAGKQKTLLLPSGIVMHYLEWGNDTAPPVVMLHDVASCSHEWDEVARPLAEKYRVLAIDFRGHGESTHSTRREYSIEHLVGDLHELVVRLSLNGRAWGGEFTRPWVLFGRGMGAAVAVGYAAQHEGRVGGLVLWDFDPEWPKDRLNFYPYQAAHFPCQEACAAMLNATMQLKENSKHLALQFINTAYALDEGDNYAGVRFRIDPFFFLAHFNAGVAWTLLRAVAARCRLLLLHTENSREWSYARAMEVTAALQQGGEARGVQMSIVNRGTTLDELKQVHEDFGVLYASAAAHALRFADALDAEQRAGLRARGEVRYEQLSEEELLERRYAAESRRLAAKEAAQNMRQDDLPPPSFEEDEVDIPDGLGIEKIGF